MDHGLLSTQNLVKLLVVMEESLRGFSLFARTRNLANSDFDFFNHVLPSVCKDIIIIIIIIITTEIVFYLLRYQKYFFHEII